MQAMCVPYILSSDCKAFEFESSSGPVAVVGALPWTQPDRFSEHLKRFSVLLHPHVLYSHIICPAHHCSSYSLEPICWDADRCKRCFDSAGLLCLSAAVRCGYHELQSCNAIISISLLLSNL